ncbi:MBL fold metallo-hydrolase [Oerskovia flava]|uniref:MBL fold metallo-hydrolase n=1 Tax=Oerskovia flava TaxID=2986422 RepID=UPI002240B93F|nr:MBL fold metallo-hydrolase [Oerskovia sp. JB1-3-2]
MRTPPTGPAPTPVTRLVTVVRADNPGPMTLDGTRSYLVAAPGNAGRVVVDPGPDDVVHLERLASGARVELVLVTHRHADHTGGAARLHARTGAPVRAADPAHCHGGRPLTGGEVIEAAGVRIEVLATPGHTADSVCFVLPDDGPSASVLTGDTVLGRGTTVLAEPDGSLRDYLASLDRLEALTRPEGPAVVGLPGHGPAVEDLGEKVRAYRAHRLERLDQVRAVLVAQGVDASAPGAVDLVVAHVYGDVDPSVRGAARQSVTAQLVYLRGTGAP